MKFATPSSLKALGDIRHDGHCRSLNLSCEAEIFSKTALAGNLIYGRGKLSRLLLSHQILKPFYFAHTVLFLIPQSS